MHRLGIAAFDKVRRPAISFEQVFEFLMGNARQNGWVVNLVTVEMQDG